MQITNSIFPYQLTAEMKSFRELPILLDELWKYIFLKVQFKSLYRCTLVAKKWKILTDDKVLVQKLYYEGLCFNPSDWNKFYMEGVISYDIATQAFHSLPSNFVEILKGPCPIFLGKRVLDTHVLVWVPEGVTIDDVGCFLKELPEFSNNSKGYKVYNLAEDDKIKPITAGWLLMTTDLIPKSRTKTMDAQKILIEDIDSKISYRIPKVGEVIICIIAEYLKSKKRKRLFKLGTSTRCQETIRAYSFEANNIVTDQPVSVGWFGPSGLEVVPFHFSSYENIGIAAISLLSHLKGKTS